MTTYTLEREDTGQELTAFQIRDEAARLDGAASDTRWRPGDPWVPKDPYASMRCRCGKVHESALIAPTAEELAAEGSTIAEEMVRGVDRKPGWPTWLGEIHHADAEWADIVARLRSMPDAYTAPPIERTVVEPVEVDYSYQQSDAWLWAEMVRGQSRQRDSVYSELAPENITQDSPSDATGQNREATPPTTPERASGRGSGAETPQSPVNGPDDRQPSPPGAPDRPAQDLTPAERAIVEEATQRRKRLAEAAQGERAELPAPTPTANSSDDAVTTLHKPEGTVRESWWARLAAWFGGATTRRRQTEQDGGA